MTREDLIARRRGLPNAVDVLNTPAAQEDNWNQRQTLDKRLNSISAADETLAEVNPELSELSKQREVLLAIRQRHADAMAPLAGATDRASANRREGLRCGIGCIDGRVDPVADGYLADMPLLKEAREAGYPPTPENPLGGFFGALPTIEHRIRHLENLRADAERSIELALRDPPTV
jgi:hypothetical protein